MAPPVVVVEPPPAVFVRPPVIVAPPPVVVHEYPLYAYAAPPVYAYGGPVWRGGWGWGHRYYRDLGCPLCPPEADIRVTHPHVGFWPKSCRGQVQQTASLFDDLGTGEHLLRYGDEAEPRLPPPRRGPLARAPGQAIAPKRTTWRRSD
jgi:hypothetical protein